MTHFKQISRFRKLIKKMKDQDPFDHVTLRTCGKRTRTPKYKIIYYTYYSESLYSVKCQSASFNQNLTRPDSL